jgi:hypothetical protein
MPSKMFVICSCINFRVFYDNLTCPHENVSQKRRSVTIVHKGNIMKFTEGGFKEWGYEVAVTQFRDHVITERESWIVDNKDKGVSDIVANCKQVEPGYDMMTEAQQKKLQGEVSSVLAAIYATHGNGQWKKKLLIKDAIADIALQQVLTRAQDFDVIATMNLNGDYLSDALAAQVTPKCPSVMCLSSWKQIYLFLVFSFPFAHKSLYICLYLRLAALELHQVVTSTTTQVTLSSKRLMALLPSKLKAL